MQLLTATDWQDYELIDSGNFEKLERFGDYYLARPEPQALWDKALSEQEWKRMAHAHFIKERNNPDKGTWQLRPGIKEQWYIGYRYKEMNLKFRLGFTSFRHVGLFPEQAVNWNYLYDAFSGSAPGSKSMLNLFAYTGGATLAARAAGASVVHVDSVKQVVYWAGQNAEANNLDGIRWIVDDAMKFSRREVNRGNVYDAIMLDPPPYGRGPKGEKWILEDNLNEMMKSCRDILAPDNGRLILNVYAIGFSSMLVYSLGATLFPNAKQIDYGELYESDKHDRRLSRGIYLRILT
ncbi:MAG: class I SAM-dependent methyltransferase [Bacteroidales bacterium]|nr:class I SAM-dependent methyltransferase [Bacteroidales bacterium]